MKVSTIKSILVLLCIKGCLTFLGPSNEVTSIADSKSDSQLKEEKMSSESSSNSSFSAAEHEDEDEDEDEDEYEDDRLSVNDILSDSRKMAEILSTQKLSSLLEDINDISSDDETALEVDENDLRFLGNEMPQWQENIWNSQISTMDWTKSGIDKGPLPYEIEGLPWYRDGKDLFRQNTAPNPLDVEAVLYDEL